MCLIILSAGFTILRPVDAFSMGMDHDDCVYFDSQIALGRDPDEIFKEIHPECWNPNRPDLNADLVAPGVRADSNTTAQAPAVQPAPASNAGSTNNANNTKASTQPKTVTHDFSVLNDDAKTAFTYFTKDGQPDSCYLNISADSKQNVITGKELNATRAGNEAGKVSFVSENKVVYEWLFDPSWASTDDYELDLTISFNKLDNSEYPDTYELLFADNKTMSENVIKTRINTGLSNTELHMYKEDNGNYSEVNMLTSDKDGFIEFQPWDLGRYVVSKTDIIKTIEGKATESEKKTEPEPSPEPSDDGGEAEITETSEPEITPVPTEAPEPEPAPAVQQSSFPTVPVVIAVIVVLAVIIALVVIKRKM